MHDAGRLQGGDRCRGIHERSFDGRVHGGNRPACMPTAPALTTIIVDERTEQQQRGEMDDEGERHHAAVLGHRPLDRKHRRQDRGDDQSRELEGEIGLRPAHESQEHDRRRRYRRKDEQAGVTRKRTHFFKTRTRWPDRSRGGRQSQDQTG